MTSRSSAPAWDVRAVRGVTARDVAVDEDIGILLLPALEGPREQILLTGDPFLPHLSVRKDQGVSQRRMVRPRMDGDERHPAMRCQLEGEPDDLRRRVRVDPDHHP
jgi:hypothetical protein